MRDFNTGDLVLLAGYNSRLPLPDALQKRNKIDIWVEILRSFHGSETTVYKVQAVEVKGLSALEMQWEIPAYELHMATRAHFPSISDLSLEAGDVVELLNNKVPQIWQRGAHPRVGWWRNLSEPTHGNPNFYDTVETLKAHKVLRAWKEGENPRRTREEMERKVFLPGDQVRLRPYEKTWHTLSRPTVGSNSKWLARGENGSQMELDEKSLRLNLVEHRAAPVPAVRNEQENKLWLPERHVFDPYVVKVVEAPRLKEQACVKCGVVFSSRTTSACWGQTTWRAAQEQALALAQEAREAQPPEDVRKKAMQEARTARDEQMQQLFWKLMGGPIK
jgi:hypothetical protein